MSYYLLCILQGSQSLNSYNIVNRKDKDSKLKYYYKLMKHIKFVCTLNVAKRMWSLANSYDKILNTPRIKEKSIKFFDAHSSSVEIVMADGQWVTRYFEISPIFLSFSPHDKKNFWLTANLDNAKSTIRDFVKFTKDKINELHLVQQMQDKSWWLKDCASNSNWSTDVLRLLIVLINGMIFFDFSHASEDNDTSNSGVIVIIFSLAIIILLFFWYRMIIQSWISLKLLYKRTETQWIEKGTWSHSKSMQAKLMLGYFHQNIENTLATRGLWMLFTCIIFCILGLTINLCFYAYTMVYFIFFSRNMIEVTRAVWQPRKRILSTVALILIAFYWSAIIAYTTFKDDFDSAVPGSSDSIIGCLVVIFDSWYKWGMGAFLAEQGVSGIVNDNNEYDPRISRVVFDFAFFFIVPTLLLSILSGIIIDNFAERRAKNDSIADKINDKCFVCDRNSDEIRDFDYHYKYVHNIWDYMFYIGYLEMAKSSDLIDYRDIYVKKCIKENSLWWFPCYKDFVLQRKSNSEYKYEDYASTSISKLHGSKFGTILDQQISDLSQQVSNLEGNLISHIDRKFDALLERLDLN